jgi:O-antigen/teichoic acid export membrane protein
MRQVVDRLSRSTIVYGLGTVAQSALQFLLVPLYTRVLSEEEYGSFALLLSILAVGEVVFRAGLHFAYLTLLFHEAPGEDRQRLARTTWTALLLQAALLLGVLWPLAPLFCTLLGVAEHALSLRLVLLYLFVSTPTALMLSLLRGEERPTAFVLLNVGQLGLTLIANVVFVAVLRWGVTGAFLGYVASGVVFGTACAFRLVARLGFGLDASAGIALLRLGASYALANLLSQGFVYTNRWLLAALGSLRDVALFDLGYRASMVVQLLVVSPFSVAWATGLFAVAASERPQETFARLLSYLLAILCFVALGVSLLAPEGVLVLGGRAYLPAATVVPWIATGYVFFGVYTFLTMGPALRKRSVEIVVATLTAVMVNIAINLALIPWLATTGAALASLVSFGVLASAMYLGAQRCYPVAYEVRRLLLVGALYGANLLAGAALFSESSFSLMARAALVVSFPFQLRAVSFFRPEETAALGRILQEIGRWSRRLVR